MDDKRLRLNDDLVGMLVEKDKRGQEPNCESGLLTWFVLARLRIKAALGSALVFGFQ